MSGFSALVAGWREAWTLDGLTRRVFAGIVPPVMAAAMGQLVRAMTLHPDVNRTVEVSVQPENKDGSTEDEAVTDDTEATQILTALRQKQSRLAEICSTIERAIAR